MKKLYLFFALQVLAGLSYASAAQAHDVAFHVAVAAHPYVLPQDYLPWWGVVAVLQPPMTLPALANYEVGATLGQPASRGGARCQRPVYEVELWRVVPKTILFSRSGVPIATPGS